MTVASPVPAKPAQRPLAGIALIVVAMLFLPVMDGICGLLLKRMEAVEVIWGRTIASLLLIAPVLLWQGGVGAFRSSQPRLQLLRGLCMTGSGTLFIASLRFTPLADALAIFFVQPFVITALSPLLLGERVGPLKWLAVAAGFLGTLIVIRPGFADLTPGVLLALGAGLCFAGAMLLTRRLAGRDSALLTVALTCVVAILALSVLLPWSWTPPSAGDLGLMALAGAIYALGLYMVTRAYDLAAASLLAPFGYVEIVGGVIVGFVMLGQLPEPLVWLGIAVIVTSGVVLAWGGR